MIGILKAVTGRALLFAGLTLVGGVAGYYYAIADSAEARTQAVMEATAKAEARYQESLKRASVRARAHLETVERLRRDLREKDRAVERYAESAAGAETCLDPEGVQQWNRL